MDIESMSAEQAISLREQIALNSMRLGDYENDLGIPPAEAHSFFDGYLEYLEELMSESIPGFGDDMFGGRLAEFDTKENLLGWLAAWQS